jgi:hypothetical protein
MTTTQTETTGYMQTYETFWKAIVENEDGTLNKDQVARELSDALALQGHLTEIYMAVSDGRVSKPFTLPSVVIAMYEDSLTEAADAAINDLITALEEDDDGSYPPVAEFVETIRTLTGVEPARAEG